MKKLIAIFAILVFAAPALAADWAFYGQSRFKTFWEQKYRHDTPTDGDSEWNLQNQSRFGARVKADKITGHIQLRLRALDTGDNTVNTGVITGKWAFADNMFLLVGKDNEIIDMTDVSNQVYGPSLKSGDNDLTGLALSTGRVSQITLGIGNFQLSAVEPVTSIADDNLTIQDRKIPKLNALYTLNLDKTQLRFGGGYQYLEVNDGDGNADEVHSYILAAVAKVPIGALYINGTVFYGQNINAANWGNGGIGQVDAYGNVDTNANGRIKDSTNYGAAGALGLNFSDTIQFEAGGGVRLDDTDVSAHGEEAFWNAYVQMTYKFAPNCKLTPEVGYISRMDEFDGVNAGETGGHDWYAGLQWRIDF